MSNPLSSPPLPSPPLPSPQELKLRIVKQCLQELVDGVLVPCSGWTMDGASSPVARPAFVQWKTELKNTTGTYTIPTCIHVYTAP